MSELIQSLQEIGDENTVELMQCQQLVQSLSEGEQCWQTSQATLNDILSSVITSIVSIRFFADSTWVYEHQSALLNADMKCSPHEVGRSPRQPFSPGRREPELLSPLLLGEG